MQKLFPEGSFFSYALTSMAAARTGQADQLVAARHFRDRLETPAQTEIFGAGMTPEHGIFATGWTLMAGVDVASASGSGADRQADRQWLARRAPIVLEALIGSRTGFPASYPGQYWPCDAVVAAAAVASAARILDRPDWLAELRTWRTRISAADDAQLGLLPHRVDEDGSVIEAPRGSSQALIQAFWPQLTRALDGHPDLGTWRRFTGAFVTRTAGLVGVRQFPLGEQGAGDIDSGPLLLGVSLSATVVTLAAANSIGDLELADALDRQAELAGVGITWSGERRYAFGELPVGDAFLAWARTRPVTSDDPPSTVVTPEPWWPALIAASLSPALLGLLLVALIRRRRRPVSRERAG